MEDTFTDFMRMFLKRMYDTARLKVLSQTYSPFLHYR